MKGEMRRLVVTVAVSLALVVLPAANRAAAAPCASSAPMDCCAGMGDDAAPPCHCSWNAVPPAPAAVDGPQALCVVLVEAPLAVVAVESPAAGEAVTSVAPRARSAPLFLLHSVLLV